MAGKLYVFRHAQSEDNENQIFSGGRDVPLTNKGLKEAKKLAQTLKNTNIHYTFCSDLIRSMMTMEIVMQFHQNTFTCIDKRLRERSYGLLEGQNKKKWAKYAFTLFKIFHRSYYIPPPGGESFFTVRKRVREFIVELISFCKDKEINVAICVHSGSIRAFREYFEGLPKKTFNIIETAEAELFIYDILDGQKKKTK